MKTLELGLEKKRIEQHSQDGKTRSNKQPNTYPPSGMELGFQMPLRRDDNNDELLRVSSRRVKIVG